MAELSSQLKKKGHELSEAHRKVGDMRETLDCTWSIVQKSGGGGTSLLSDLDTECKLANKAHLLLAVNDEAAVERKKEKIVSASATPTRAPATQTRHRHSHHVSNNDRQHWLLGYVINILCTRVFSNKPCILVSNIAMTAIQLLGSVIDTCVNTTRVQQ